MSETFKLLKIFSSFFKMAAWTLLLVVGGVGTVATLMGTDGSFPTPKWGAILALLTGIFWFVIFYTISEVIRILLAIEANSRKT
ncbi:MAG: hypothetical protein NC819_03985 [Candidatus Omnitrophica bacterium]|nr:hypothetical protein [Candidatus Omnitrophota bacterium]